jgi:carboxymethylenebutenolidase
VFLAAIYCFGGAIAARIGSTDSVDTLVLAHPGPLTAEQIRAIKVTPYSSPRPAEGLTCVFPQVPTSWALAEGQSRSVLFLDVHRHLLADADDSFFKDKSAQEVRAIFKEQEKPDHVDYEFRVWKGDNPLGLRVHVSIRLDA